MIRAGNFLFCHGFVAVLQHHFERIVGLLVEFRHYNELFLVDVGAYNHCFQAFCVNGFHPYGLPYTCYAGIEATIRSVLAALLAAGLFAGAHVVFNMHHEVMCLTRLYVARNVDCKRR